MRIGRVALISARPAFSRCQRSFLIDNARNVPPTATHPCVNSNVTLIKGLEIKSRVFLIDFFSLPFKRGATERSFSRAAFIYFVGVSSMFNVNKTSFIF